ncbi:hypothetical protein ABT324_15540 [Saccharopolyspora sp. NPDC000359]|uniref:hypothetical protein n=1 Tax=Saccharopolyspora sp. NPDC000359 TaxID=3154251 RepID=UPI00332A97EB
MSAKTVALAVFLRRTQWLIDDLAFHAAVGQLDDDEVDAAATALEEVVRLLRESRPVVLDHPGGNT